MAVLVDGRQYGLSSQGNSTDNKSYLFVKLTDSALKAIEDHVRTGGRSTISFDKNDGKIAFENGSQFQFNISSNPDQGSFECIQQHGSSRLESLGCMGYKMRVQANDDVYETTRQRVANVEEASKKSCTRMIKQSDPFIGRRVKVKAPPGRAVPPPAAARPRHRPDPVGPAQHRSPTRPLQPRPAPPAAQSRPPPPPPATAATSTAAATGGSAPGRPATSVAGGSAPGRPAAAAAGVSAPGRPAAAAADLMRRPLKERLAHLLAIRPLKKIEVMQKLYKDGIREKDKKNVHGLLGSVATIRDNVYHLKRHIWNEVSGDWPFYSEQERREFISHRPENVTPPGSDSSSSSRSPAGKRPSPSSADPLPVGCSPVTLPKKPRVSHYRRPGENPAAERLSTVSATVSAMSQGAPVPAASASASANAMRPRLSASAGGHGVAEQAGERRNTGPQGYEWHKTQSSSQSPSSTGVSDRTPTPDSSPDSHHSSGSSASGSHRADLEHEHDYRSQYVPITCESQLQRYKGDFESGYQEYQQLWELVSSVYRKFAELEQQLHAAEKGSEEWKGIERKIRDEYEACNNEQYRTARRRWFYLQNKLQYVKSLVRRWQAER